MKVYIKNNREYPKEFKQTVLAEYYKTVELNNNVYPRGLVANLARKFNVSNTIVHLWIKEKDYGFRTVSANIKEDYILYRGIRYEPVCKIR
jgi:transposase-like protein